jgi:CxC2 like cysteine cluster associated with KDZ transposases
MREWLPKRTAYLGRIISTEWSELTCKVCKETARWRCLCCLGRPMFCRGCCRKSHDKLIYHRLQKWTGLYFQDAGLWEVGVRLCVGHMGENCPSQETLLETCSILEDEKDRADVQLPHPKRYEDPDYVFDDGDPDYVDGDPDDPDWQDIPASQTDPLRTPAPIADELDINHLLLVDASGLISLPTIWCTCEAAERKPDEDLLDLQLFPISYRNIKTVFTFRSLDDYRLSNLECKTTAYQYYQKLRRLTNPALPQSVPNRYIEFRRATRQWRNLKLRKWFGFGHRELLPTKGSMALFCAACPQPGVNLPADYMTRYTS